MTAYAIGLFTAIEPHAEVADYLERIQASLDPFDGRFLAHNTESQTIEGEWSGNVVIIEFPDLGAARGWYESKAYQAILPLRLKHVSGDALLVPGVDRGYRAATLGEQMRAALQ